MPDRDCEVCTNNGIWPIKKPGSVILVCDAHMHGRKTMMSDWIDVTTSHTTQSHPITDLAAALCKAQAAMKGATKDRANPFFKSRYADLASVWDACREPLTANGLSVIQMPDRNEKEIGLTTLLLHASGQWVASRAAAVPVKDDPQAVGSCITYLRRYSLAAVVGVCPEDDDGERASGRNGTIEQPSTADDIRMLAKKKGVDVTKILEAYSVESLEDLDAEQTDQTIRTLRAKKDVGK